MHVMPLTIIAYVLSSLEVWSRHQNCSDGYNICIKYAFSSDDELWTRDPLLPHHLKRSAAVPYNLALTKMSLFTIYWAFPSSCECSEARLTREADGAHLCSAASSCASFLISPFISSPVHHVLYCFFYSVKNTRGTTSVFVAVWVCISHAPVQRVWSCSLPLAQRVDDESRSNI